MNKLLASFGVSERNVHCISVVNETGVGRMS